MHINSNEYVNINEVLIMHDLSKIIKFFFMPIFREFLW